MFILSLKFCQDSTRLINSLVKTRLWLINKLFITNYWMNLVFKVTKSNGSPIEKIGFEGSVPYRKWNGSYATTWRVQQPSLLFGWNFNGLEKRKNAQVNSFCKCAPNFEITKQRFRSSHQNRFSYLTHLKCLNSSELKKKITVG